LRNILERSLLQTPEDAAWLMLDSTGMGHQRTAARPGPSGPGSNTPVERSAEGPDLSAERADLTPLEAQEYRLIRQTLRETHGGIRRAATKLGLSPQALLRRLDKWPELRPTRPVEGDPRSERP
jgi:DNA-binding NtrC family response regulator